MKIVHVIPNLLKGGAERIVLNICNELNAQKEHEVLLITFQADNAYSFLNEHLNWKVIPSKVIPSISGKPQISVTELQAALFEFQADIVHAHLFESIMVLSQVGYHNARYFFHFHDNMHQFANFSWNNALQKNTWTNLFEKRLILKSFADKKVTAIAISEDTFQYAKSVLPASIDVHKLLNAIDYNRFYSPLSEKNVLSLVKIGSFVAKKNQLLAIQTIELLKNRGFTPIIHLIGDGPKRTELEQYVIQNNLSDLVVFEGSVDHPEEILRNASLYLHTAKIEPFGLVLIEAMASGLPVVCTNGGGNRDLVEDGINGFMVEEFSAQLLADKIEYLINNPEKRIEMGKAALEFSKQFDISEYVKKLIKLYRKHHLSQT